MRHEGAGLAQQMIYGHKGHGIFMMSFYMPNGIHCWYGPVSARRNELNVLNWSGADDLLYEVQTAIGQQLYASFGDKIFCQGNWRCIKAARRGPLPANDDPVLRNEEKNLNKTRIPIEWEYAGMKSKFKLSIRRDNFRFKHDPEYALAEFRVLGLLKNIHACFNGTAANGSRTFAFPPPSIDDYLVPVADPVPNPVTQQEWCNL